MADQSDPPATQGMRGEGSADVDPQFGRAIRLESGRTVVVRQGSGVAYAEATGRIGRAPIEDDGSAPTAPPSIFPIIAATLGGFVVGAMLAGYASPSPPKRAASRT